MNSVIILIPIYKNHLEDYEDVSFSFILKNLAKYKKMVISPFHLKDDYKFNDILKKYNLNAVFFDDFFFRGIDGYNKLMLNLAFYSYFSKYKYMLIYQLDALVFSDNLDYWLNKDYDYIGAPWLTSGENPIFDSMGNGGFSLRKTDKFIQVLESKKFYFTTAKYFSTSIRIGVKNILLLKFFKKFKLNSLNLFLYFYNNNEDYFWSFLAQYFVDTFNLPSPKEALKFSFEVNPRKCFHENNLELPFGCHAWQRYDILFWTEQFPEIKQMLETYDVA